ncbi:MAG: isoaspartyl peptidase/L-asparaginase family protein [Gammaproteobacteria bacterium]
MSKDKQAVNWTNAAGCLVALVLLAGCSITPPTATSVPAVASAPAPHGLVIHGGAGSGSRANISPELEAAMRAAMGEALASGFQVLDDGGSSLDAVTAAILVLEEAPVFNAGVGAVFNAVGSHELDASIMDGATMNAGAAAGVSTVRNPILLARAVMEHSPHVMLSGSGAEAFSKEHNLEQVTPDFFDTERRRQQLEKRLARDRNTAATDAATSESGSNYFGTVGVVALDKRGNLAAGTSTGGMTAKRYGRIGDSPVVGAGTYANNASCGVSSTGHGEFFIRHVVAYNICARMQFRGDSLEKAADDVIMKELVEVGASGGVVAMDAKGNIAWPFNSDSMTRAHQSRDQPPRVLIFKNE